MVETLDIHTHILPGIDDSAGDIQNALDMIRMAYENGTRTLFFTPHYRENYERNTPDCFRETFALFQNEVHRFFPKIDNKPPIVNFNTRRLWHIQYEVRKEDANIYEKCRD